MKKLLVIALASAAVSFSLPLAAAGDKAAGQAKAAVCGACHGMDGNSLNPVWPSLASQHPSYIVSQLEAFKTQQRTDPTMAPQAVNLSAQDMEDLAAFFASQPRKQGQADAASIELGEAIYRGGISSGGVAACTGCHGPRGAGNPTAKYPGLGGQHAAYTAKQLRMFRNGERANDPGKMMRNVAHRMTDKEVDAVAQYIAGLH